MPVVLQQQQQQQQPIHQFCPFKIVQFIHIKQRTFFSFDQNTNTNNTIKSIFVEIFYLFLEKKVRGIVLPALARQLL